MSLPRGFTPIVPGILLVIILCVVGPLSAQGSSPVAKPVPQVNPSADEDGGEPPAPDHAHRMSDENIYSATQSAVNTLAAHLKVFELFVLVFIFIGGSVTIFFQVEMTRRRNRELKGLKEKMAEQMKTLELWRTQTMADFRKENVTAIEGGIEEAFSEKLGAVLRSEYEKEIFRFVANYSQEVLLQAPELRGLFLSRLRRLASSLQKALAPCGEEVSREVARALKAAMQDWYTLGLLASSDPEHLETGLHHARANPVPESRKRLKLLRERWKDEPRLVPLIERALKELEERRAK